MPRGPKVAIIQRYIPHYRAPFFENLKTALDALGIDLHLVRGQPGARDAAKKDSSPLPWATSIRNTVITIRGRELYWQPCLHLVRDADLIIVEQASKLLVNYPLLLLNATGLTRMAFWGHGRNFQDSTSSLFGEAAKRFASRRVYWWFAYNELSAKVVEGLGFPRERITVVNNAIDTEALRIACDAVSEQDLDGLKNRLGIRGSDVCLYIGGMYAEKRLNYLIEASCEMRSSNPEFEMVFLGAGPDDHIVREAAERWRWIHYLGPVLGLNRAPFLKMSRLILMPGLVGLVVLDAFAARAPLVTTDVPWHSPEIAYLEDGKNGIIVGGNPTPSEYASAVLDLLADESRRKVLIEGCIRATTQYTAAGMVERFAQGVVRALGLAQL